MPLIEADIPYIDRRPCRVAIILITARNHSHLAGAARGAVGGAEAGGTAAVQNGPGSPEQCDDAALRACLREGVREPIFTEAKRQGWPVSDGEGLRVFALDIGLNADGLAVWLSTRASAPR